MDKIMCLCDSHHGQYLPSVWCSNTENIWNINQEDWEYLKNPENIENDDYWEIWNNLLNDAVYLDEDGIIWALHQEGDLFAIALDDMSEQEKEDFFGYG